MTIRRATEEVEIKEGDFILGAGFVNYHLVGNAGKVTRIAGKRIYYDRQHAEGILDSTHMNRDQVRFVCDTQDEVEKLKFLSLCKYREMSTAVRDLELSYENSYETHLSMLIRGAA